MIPEKKIRKSRKKAIVIPEDATPLEVFMLTKDFTIAQVSSITLIPKDILLGIIKGNEPTEEQRRRIRLTTGVII